MKKNKQVDDWGIDAPDIDNYAANLQTYISSITKHKCGVACNESKHHEHEKIWDYFELSQRQRERMQMEVLYCKGRERLERLMIRRFVSTADGSYVLRLEAVSDMTHERMGDIHFDEEGDCNEYYNHCIKLFNFTEVEPIGVDPEPFFDDEDEWNDPEEESWVDEEDDTWNNW